MTVRVKENEQRHAKGGTVVKQCTRIFGITLSQKSVRICGLVVGLVMACIAGCLFLFAEGGGISVVIAVCGLLIVVLNLAILLGRPVE